MKHLPSHEVQLLQRELQCKFTLDSFGNEEDDGAMADAWCWPKGNSFCDKQLDIDADAVVWLHSLSGAEDAYLQHYININIEQKAMHPSKHCVARYKGSHSP